MDPESVRRRPSTACLRCRLQHKKCDGGRPCSRCIELGTSHLCKDQDEVLPPSSRDYWASSKSASSLTTSQDFSLGDEMMPPNVDGPAMIADKMQMFVDIAIRHSILQHSSFFRKNFGDGFVENLFQNLRALSPDQLAFVEEWSYEDVNLESYITNEIMKHPKHLVHPPALFVQPAPPLEFFLWMDPLRGAGPLSFVSEEFTRVFGWDMDSILDKRITLATLMHKDDLDDNMVLAAQAVVEGRTHVGSLPVKVHPSSGIRYRIMKNDGTFLSCLQERHILFTKMRLPAFVVCIFHDFQPAVE